jgi:aerobic carbon-monoxide dehydrogenase medium subunit
MKASPFGYIKPDTLSACLAALGEHGEEAQVIAGGQSLMPLMNLRLAAPSVLIDIAGIAELRGIRREPGQIIIGAMETHAALTRSPIVREELPLLALAAPHIAHVAVRSRGTIGGSLALADPAAEWPACCLALNARIELTGGDGVRLIAAEDFFQGVFSTARRPDELLTAIRFPVPSADRIHLFDEISRRRGDFAIAGLALSCRRDGTRLADVRLALFGVADCPILAHGAMAVMEGSDLGGADVGTAMECLSNELEPPEDSAYPADFRRRIAATMLERALGDLRKRLSHAG